MSNVLARVLCVDDDPNVLVGLRLTLRGKFHVTTALGGAAAIEAIKSGEGFAVMVTDLQMPEMDGIELLRWVAANAPDVTGILLTGNANLVAAIAAVNAGYVFRFLTKPCPQDELCDAIAAAHERHLELGAQRVLLRQAVDQDALTGLPDRRRLVADAARLRANEPDTALSLVVVALDDLDLVRRTLGHAVADGLMVAAARRLQATIRDPRYQLRHAVLFRIDDRLALLWCEQRQSPASLVAEILVKALDSEVSVAGHKLRLSGYAGIGAIAAKSLASGPQSDPMTMLRDAESACLEAIASGGSRIGNFSSSAHTREQRDLRLLQRLHDPQFVEHLTCVYQPQWDLVHNRLHGMEALVRWEDPELGSVSPSEFVPIAERDPEVAGRLGDWVLRTACRQRHSWRGLIAEDVRVAVNISATQLRSSDLHERILECLAATGLAPCLLEVEITESAAISDFAKSELQLQELRRHGIHVAIDDFGVGFSSLSYLAELPATSLKIDRTFVRGVEQHGSRADLLRGICSLGHAMRMQVVVEGVESLGAAAWLKALGCDVAQGFAIARPMSGAAFSQWLDRECHAIGAALGDTFSDPRVLAIAG